VLHARSGQPQAVIRKCSMQSIAQFFTSFFAVAPQAKEAGEACSLLERAATSRGMSHDEAAQLRINALAMLSVVR
jgi:hypothetical protein